MFKQLITNIKKSDTAVFCGAGISYHSGLPLVSHLIKKIFEVMDVSEADAEIILNSNMPFETFVETIHNEVSIDEILEIFAKGVPSTTHELIAELVSEEYVKTIMTTNFDTLIEKALINKGLSKGKDFNVFSSESDFGKIDWEDNCVKIIKIHGCISDKDKMAITLSSVANKALCKNKDNVIEKFFSKNVNPNVLMVGYSCSDLFDISPKIEEIKTEGSSNVYLIEHNGNECYTMENIALKDYKNPFKTFSGERVFVNTDFFVKNTWESLLPVPYEFKANTTPWTENIDKWMLETIEENCSGVKNQLAARLFYSIGEYRIAVSHFEQSIFLAQKDGNRQVFYSEMGNLGMTFNALGRYKEAKTCLEESSASCRDIGNLQGEISQLQALGNVCRNLGEFESAIEVYNRAIFLSEREKDIFSLCNSLGNAASVYIHTSRPDEAIKYLDKGIVIAIAIGDKQSEGSMLSSFGQAYWDKGNNEKAILYTQKSIDMTRMIGDKQGECMALHNLSNINLRQGDFDNCLVNANTALEIAQKIGSMPTVAMAYYNIGNSHLYKGNLKSAHQNLKVALDMTEQIYGTDSPRLAPILKSISFIEDYTKS